MKCKIDGWCCWKHALHIFPAFFVFCSEWSSYFVSRWTFKNNNKTRFAWRGTGYSHLKFLPFMSDASVAGESGDVHTNSLGVSRLHYPKTLHSKAGTFQKAKISSVELHQFWASSVPQLHKCHVKLAEHSLRDHQGHFKWSWGECVAIKFHGNPRKWKSFKWMDLLNTAILEQ